MNERISKELGFNFDIPLGQSQRVTSSQERTKISIEIKNEERDELKNELKKSTSNVRKTLLREDHMSEII